MQTSLEALSGESRIYIFPSSRKFYKDESPEVLAAMESFCQNFKDVEIAFEFQYDRFLVFIVSETTPLSIEQNDELVAFVQSLEKKYELQLLDKVNVCFKQGEHVQRKEIPDFKKMIKSKSVSVKTVVFDPTVHNKAEYESSWETPAGESWLSHFF